MLAQVTVSLLVRLRVEILYDVSVAFFKSVSLLVRLRVEITILTPSRIAEIRQPPREAAS